MSAEQGLAEAPGQHAGDRAGQDQAGHEQAEHGEYEGSQAYEVDSDGQRVSPGMGQSKSSRRRRRKRKGKGEGGDAPTAGGAATGSAAGAGGAAAPFVGGAMPGEVIGGMQANAAPMAEQPAAGGYRQNGAPARSFGGGQNGQNGMQNGIQGGMQNGNPTNGASTPGGTKRWKKKSFRDRDRPRQAENPGNQQGASGFAQPNNGYGQGYSQNGQSNNGGGFRGPDTHQPGNSAGFKRKGGFGGGKQRNGGGGGGARNGFVGPMDHSYRAPNGNIFDPSPSTSEPYQGGGGGGRGRSYQSDSQPIDYSQGRVIPIKEGTQTRIYFFIEDLFFTAKIQETARKLGVKVEFLKNDKERIAELTSADEENRPGLIVFDLNNANAKPLMLIPKLKTKLKKSTSIIGFLSHLQGDLKAKAVEAGCDTVMPRAAFSQNLPNLLRRYGIEEVEEQNYNQ